MREMSSQSTLPQVVLFDEAHGLVDETMVTFLA